MSAGKKQEQAEKEVEQEEEEEKEAVKRGSVKACNEAYCDWILCKFIYVN